MDEPALREGLPLKQERWRSYLEWAVKSFRLATAVAKSETQIVTHLCYSEFADILEVASKPSIASRYALVWDSPALLFMLESLFLSCLAKDSESPRLSSSTCCVSFQQAMRQLCIQWGSSR